MPIEIKELVIRAIVTQTPERGEVHAPSPESSDGSSVETAIDHDAVVREAVKEVLRILKAAKER